MQRLNDSRTLQSAGTNPSCRWTMSPGTRSELRTRIFFALRVVQTLVCSRLLVATCSRRPSKASWNRSRKDPRPSNAPDRHIARRTAGFSRTLPRCVPAKRPAARATGRMARMIAAVKTSAGDSVGSDACSSFRSFCAHARACALVESPREREV